MVEKFYIVLGSSILGGVIDCLILLICFNRNYTKLMCIQIQNWICVVTIPTAIFGTTDFSKETIFNRNRNKILIQIL